MRNSQTGSVTGQLASLTASAHHSTLGFHLSFCRGRTQHACVKGVKEEGKKKQLPKNMENCVNWLNEELKSNY